MPSVVNTGSLNMAERVFGEWFHGPVLQLRQVPTQTPNIPGSQQKFHYLA